MTTHSCEKCNATFKYKCSLVKHIKNNVCTKEKTMKMWNCEVCGKDDFYRTKNGKKIADKQKYTRHMKAHKKEGTFKTINGMRIYISYTGKRYRITNSTDITKNSNLLCSHIDDENNPCYTSAQIEGFCRIHYKGDKKCKIYYCNHIDEDGNRCSSIRKQNGLCVKHGGNPTRYTCNHTDEDGIVCGRNAITNHLCSHHGAERHRYPPEKYRAYRKEYMKKKFTKFIIDGCKGSDRKKKVDPKTLENYIDEDFIMGKLEEQNYHCISCNIKLTTEKGNRDLNLVSVDRIDNSKYHTKDNCRVTCLFCNRGRNCSRLDNFNLYIDSLKNKTKQNFENFQIDKNWAYNLYNRCKQYDLKRFNLIPDITIEWIMRKLMENDYKSEYTGIKMFPASAKNNNKGFPFKPSIDRIDNSKPHNKDNVKIVCMAENYGRNDCDVDKFVEHLKVIRGNITVEI